ncbi:MAG TPA: methyltransferase domain-containing protein [Symbiobacteriaceae bacterium]|jgi:ubiquinone/menaquinone biosynthesis C-methylase UbiE
MDETKNRVRHQFQKTAEAYATSRVHAFGDDLELLPDLAGVTGSESVLDVATGAGHTAFAFAPKVARVVASDLTPAMVEQARAGAAKRGLTNLEFQVCDVDALPFHAATFDIVTCRIAPHHFPHLDSALREMARVLKPGGRCVIVDNIVPEDPELDRFVNDFEKRRDPSHVRAHTVTEWEAAYRQAGLAFTVTRTFTSDHELDSWVQASQTPADDVERLRADLTGASPAVAAHMAVRTEPVLTFRLHKAIFLGVKA